MHLPDTLFFSFTFIACDVKVINRIVNDASGVGAEVAIKLGAALNTTPDFWMNLQNAVSLHQASERVDCLPTVLAKVRAAHS
jgi:plasmid maintenance system antidote protein VapI